MSDTLDLAIDLISRRSVTPEDAGCQDVMINRLEALGFSIERMRFDDVDNFWARRGDKSPILAFAGHTDVVPTGPIEKWHSDPFVPEIREGLLYGRGAADMKGSLAAMVTACERFLADHSDHKGSLAFLVTSDEEGPSINGTVKVVDALEARGEKIDYCLIGEPTCSKTIGDVIKNGRRGSLTGYLTIHGTQGHVAYPHLARNPVHMFAPALAELSATEWDNGNEFFPPTTFQVSNIHSGTGADNVVPGDLEAVFNFRFSTETSQERLEQHVNDVLKKYDLSYDLKWHISGQPFITKAGELVDATRKAIRDVAGIETELSTSGGTSDGRFVAPTGAQVIELGPLNATIHKIDECVGADDLDTLSGYYEQVMKNLML